MNEFGSDLNRGEINVFRHWMQNYGAYAIALLFIAIVSFGFLIPEMGFYWDDWHAIFHISSDRVSDLITHYSYDRPFSFWTVFLVADLLDVSSGNWQIFTLGIRWLAGLAMWWALMAVWPRQKRRTFLVVTIFLIYPSFYLQPISVAFSQHWIGYLLFLISLGSMGWATQIQKRTKILTGIAVVAGFMHLFTLEYFAGLELIRPIYIYLLISQTNINRKEKLGQTLAKWLPYLSLWIIWLVYRVFFFELPDPDLNSPQFFSRFITDPGEEIPDFVQLVFKSYIHILWTTWGRVFDVGLGRFSSKFVSATLTIAAVSAVLTYLFWEKIFFDKEEISARKNLYRTIILLGLASIFFGLLPGFSIGREPFHSGYSERFTLAAMFGASLTWVGLFMYFLPIRIQRTFFSIVIGLAIASHFHAGNVFRWDWNTQRDFYAQLTWRAPSISPNTSFLILNRTSDYMKSSSTAYAINTLYGQHNESPYVDYWAENIDDDISPSDFSELFKNDYRGLLFEIEDENHILVTYVPKGGCLLVLYPLHEENMVVPEDRREYAKISNLSVISANTVKASRYRHEIFEVFEEKQWCYFYQTAELARQQEKWNEVLSILDEAKIEGFDSNLGIELIPFLQAAINLQQWDLAFKLSREIFEMKDNSTSLMCNVWTHTSSIWIENAEGKESFAEVRGFSDCSPP